MKSTLFALGLLIGAGAAMIGSADAASLRPHVTVDDRVVRLGDLFDEVGPAADIAVARAPAPGRRTTFDANTLYRIAHAYRIDWRPLSRFDRVVVERAGRIVATSDISARLAEALRTEGMSPHAEIALTNRRLQVAVPLDAPDSIEVHGMSFDRDSGRFSAVVLVGGDHPGAQRVAVSGRVHQTTPIPVLRRTLGPGDIIREDDVQILRVRVDQTPLDVVTDPARLVGTTPRQRLRAGEPIRASDTRAPIVVERNSLVTIVLQTGNMTLTAQGRAVEDGAKGETIRVVNLQSKKTVEATIAGPDFVTVQFGIHRAVN